MAQNKDWEMMEISIMDLMNLKILYKDAVANEKESFMFKDREILTSFAKYWIEYIETRMPKPREDQENVMYCHSKCCEAHWELVCKDGIWDLECEKCGQPVGGGISVIGPDISGCECEHCKGD